MKLVDEVLGVAADALAKLREFGLQFTDGRARDGGLGGQRRVRGLEPGWAAGALGVDAVQREVFVVAAPHGGLEALDRGSLVAQSSGLAGCDLGAVELAVGLGVDDEELGGFSRTASTRGCCTKRSKKLWNLTGGRLVAIYRSDEGRPPTYGPFQPSWVWVVPSQIDAPDLWVGLCDSLPR